MNAVFSIFQVKLFTVVEETVSMPYVRAREPKCFRSLGERARASSCVQPHSYFPAFTGQPPCHNEPARVKPGPCQRVSALHRVHLRSRIIPGSSEEHSAESRTGDRASCRGICVTVYHLPCQAAVFCITCCASPFAVPGLLLHCTVT